MLNEVQVLIFAIFGELYMALGTFLVGLVHLYISRKRDVKKWPRRIKAMNWLIMSAAFMTIYFIDQSHLIERSFLRLGFALLVLGELSFYGDVVCNVVHAVGKKLKR